MRNRYQKPPALPPNPALLEAYLRYAQPTANERLAEPDLTEALRREGVAALCALARAALAEAGDPNRLGAIPFRLRQFLMRAGLGILTADDPFAALQRFLGQKQRGRGRPAEDHDYRNILITADVAELRASLTLGAAYEEISKRPGTPGMREIERIYLCLREDLKVLAELEWRQPWPEENSNDPPPEIEGQGITREQWQAYSALAAAVCPKGMTFEDNLELWSFVRRATFPTHGMTLDAAYKAVEAIFPAQNQ